MNLEFNKLWFCMLNTNFDRIVVYVNKNKAIFIDDKNGIQTQNFFELDSNKHINKDYCLILK
jgi:hypothetical protein